MPINRREFVSFTVATASSLLMRPGIAGTSLVSAMYTRSIVIDGLGSPGGLGTDKGAALTAAQVEDVRASGMTGFNITVGAVGTMPSLEAFEKIVRDVARWEGEIDRSPAVLARVRTAEDIQKAKMGGKSGLIYGLQDGVSFEDDLDRLTALHQVGLRVIQPTYNRRNLLGDGCMEPADAGLSTAGRAAIEHMNSLGILVDLSHCGRRTASDAIAISRKPVAFTHTGCFAVAEHPRNRTDAELKAVAEKGGVCGIYVMPYLSKGRQPTAADVVAHVEHALDVCGEDHVSIGTDGTLSAVDLSPEFKADFRDNVRERRARGIAAPDESEEGYLFASDLNTPRRFETLAGLLLARGHSESRVEKLIGANLLRVFGETW